MEDERFDAIVIGGGVAGLSAAMTLARANMKFLLVERGEFAGAKNVSGGVLWGSDLTKLVPQYWEEEDGGWERFVNHRRLSLMDEQSAFTLDFKSSHWNEPPYTGVVVLRARFDNWLAGKVQEAIDASDYAEESFIATDIKVDQVIMEGGRAVGIKTGDEEFHAQVVIIAEGVNNLLTRQVGLQTEYVPADHMLTGIKEIIRFDQQRLEDRFQLRGRSGMSNEFVGWATDGVEGGGFLYTNKDTLSVGLVLSIADLRAQKKSPHDILSHFKTHPVVADAIEGGEVVEYSAHVVSSGDKRAMPREVYADGVLIIGEAANLLLNAGKAIQGMDYAMRSGILAAETVVEAKEAGDFSVGKLADYRKKLDASYIMKDINGFQDAVHVLHDPIMQHKVPNILCDFGRSFFSIDNQPTAKSKDMILDAVRRHSSLWEMAKFGFKAGRSL